MAELRCDVPDADLGVLDGYCAATGKSRADVVRGLLSEWSGKKLHEATVILRVVGAQSGGSDKGPDSVRSVAGGIKVAGSGG